MKSDGWREGEIKRLQAMRQAMARPQAASSPWESTDFCNRVLTRAERYQKLMASLDNPATEPMEPAEAKWAKLVEQIMQDEQLDRAAAMKIAKERRPDILRAMVREANKAGR